MAAYGRLLLAPAEGWWPSATWKALWALFSFRCLEGLLPKNLISVVVVPDVVARSVLKLQRSYIPLWIQENLSYSLVYFCLSGLLDAQKCEKPPVTIEDDFSDPNKPLFCVRDHQIFLAKNLSHIFICSCQISDHLNNSLRI